MPLSRKQEMSRSKRQHASVQPHNLAAIPNHGTFRAQSLVIASGGLSIPKIGATPFGYQVAQQFDIPVTKLKPGWCH